MNREEVKTLKSTTQLRIISGLYAGRRGGIKWHSEKQN